MLFETSYGDLGYGTLQSGVATLTTTNVRGIGQETENIKAQYAGDQSFYPSYGGVDILVFKWPVTVTLTSSPNPSKYREFITFTATVTSNSPVAPTGNIYFSGLFTAYAPIGHGITFRGYKLGSTTEYANFYGDHYNQPGEGSVES